MYLTNKNNTNASIKVQHLSWIGFGLSVYVLFGFSATKYIIATYLSNQFSSPIMALLRFSSTLLFLSPLVVKVIKTQGFCGLKIQNNRIKSDKGNDLFSQLIRSINTCTIIILTYKGYGLVPLSIAAVIGASEPVFVAMWSLVPKSGRKASFSLLRNVLLTCFGVILAKSGNLSSIDSSYWHGIVSLVAANILCSLGPYLIMNLRRTGSVEERHANLVNNLIMSCFLLLVLNLTMNSAELLQAISTVMFNKKIIFTLMCIGAMAAVNTYALFAIFDYIHPSIYSIIQNLNIPIFMLIDSTLKGQRIGKIAIFGVVLLFLSLILVIHHRFVVKDAVQDDKPLARDKQNMLNKFSYFGLICARIGYDIVRSL